MGGAVLLVLIIVLASAKGSGGSGGASGTTDSGGSSSPVLILPNDANLQYIGRTPDDTTTAAAVRFDMPGFEIRAKHRLETQGAVCIRLAQRCLPHPAAAEGDNIGNTANSGWQANAFVVFVDGVRQGLGRNNASFVTVKDDTEASRCYNLRGQRAGDSATLPAGMHDIRVLKATEADWNAGTPLPNYLTFSGIEVSSSAVALPQPALPTRRLEFLGDSITAGFCNTDCIYGDRLDDNNEAFGSSWDAQLGELLGAQIHTTAWSGLGMVRNCCGGNTTMPEIFRRSLATVNSDEELQVSNVWDWSRWVPDALFINLGTNDGDAVTDPDYDYVGVYTDLVLRARQHYGAELHVYLACGPMSDGYCDPVMETVTALGRRGVHAHFLDQRGLIARCSGTGWCNLDWSHCCGHPDVPVDTAMAAQAADIVREDLGW